MSAQGKDCFFLFEAAAKALPELCKHMYGCTTLQRMLEAADDAGEHHRLCTNIFLGGVCILEFRAVVVAVLQRRS